MVAMIGKRPLPMAALVALAACNLAQPAHAEHIGRPSQPVCAATAHVVVHCDAGLPDGYAEAAAADVEEAYSRLVAGGGCDPNAGLPGPIDDGDGRTDVYLRAPPGQPAFRGGIVFRDSNHFAGRGVAAYIFLTPDLTLAGLRFRAAHEFMHVLMRGYFGQYGSTFEEGFANWAAEFALPDVDPGDSNFRSPWLSFDCTSTACGQGYWQWLFFQRQVEAYGQDFMTSLLARARAAPDLTTNFIAPVLNDELAARTGLAPGEALRARFADYARKVWDPAAWRTTALATIYASGGGGPAVDADQSLWFGYRATGTKTATVDHLAARYARIRFTQALADDDLRVGVTPPPGMIAAPDVLYGRPTGPRADVALAPDGRGGFAATIPGPLTGRDVIVPLVNDSDTADALPFAWHAELLVADAELAVRRQSPASALKKGVAVTVVATKPGAVRLWVTIDGPTAKRYGLGRKVTRITASSKWTLRAATNKLRLKLTSKARKRLAKAKRLPITVLGAGSFVRGTPIEVDAVATLRK